MEKKDSNGKNTFFSEDKFSVEDRYCNIGTKKKEHLVKTTVISSQGSGKGIEEIIQEPIFNILSCALQEILSKKAKIADKLDKKHYTFWKDIEIFEEKNKKNKKRHLEVFKIGHNICFDSEGKIKSNVKIEAKSDKTKNKNKKLKRLTKEREAKEDKKLAEEKKIKKQNKLKKISVKERKEIVKKHTQVFANNGILKNPLLYPNMESNISNNQQVIYYPVPYYVNHSHFMGNNYLKNSMVSNNNVALNNNVNYCFLGENNNIKLSQNEKTISEALGNEILDNDEKLSDDISPEEDFASDLNSDTFLYDNIFAGNFYMKLMEEIGEINPLLGDSLWQNKITEEKQSLQQSNNWQTKR